MSIVSKKVCIIGDFGVGKTSLIRCFVDRQFSDQYLSTVGVKISRKIVELPTRDRQTTCPLKLLIWDIEGKTKFQSITPTYLQGASGVIIAADLSRPDTLKHIEDHLALVAALNLKRVAIALNKFDLIHPETLTTRFQPSQFRAHPLVIAVCLTSAKTGDNVDVIFHKLAHSMMNQTDLIGDLSVN